MHARGRQLLGSADPAVQQSAIDLVHSYFESNERTLGSDLLLVVGASEAPEARLFSREATASLITAGARLLLAGDAALLEGLPRGNWIGGSIPYFMTEAGGTTDRERVFVTELPELVTEVQVKSYATSELSQIPAGYPSNGCSFIIIPASSSAHLSFAEHCGEYAGLFNSPLVGWIAGSHLDDLGTAIPRVYDGSTGQSYDDRAVVLHATLASHTLARVDAVNLFRPGQGDRLEFPSAGFEVRDCRVNGAHWNFADYLQATASDARLPLVADYSGAMVNVSIQSIDSARGRVMLYAPVFPGVAYRQAAPMGDYSSAFAEEMARRGAEPVFSCNCILNYQYAALEGRHMGGLTGPVTFGEVAYILLNQTLVYVTFDDLRKLSLAPRSLR